MDPREQELAELRRILADLAAEDARHQQARALLRAQRTEQVRRLRDRDRAPRPWSHGDIADALGVSRGVIQQWEAGHHPRDKQPTRQP